jgi:hypothetical protein
MRLPSFLPTLLKLWLHQLLDVWKGSRSLDVAIFHKSACTPITKAQQCTRGFGGEMVMHVQKDEAALAEYMLYANRRTYCCKKRMRNERKYKCIDVLTLTGYGMIVESHAKQVGILASVIVPPSQKVFVLDIFRLGAEVAAHFIDSVDREAIHRDIIEHVLGLRGLRIL